MTQKTWEKNDTVHGSGIICPNCGKEIQHHKYYNDSRFCSDCLNFITEDAHKQGYSGNDVNRFVNQAYEEMTNISDAQYFQ